MTLSLFGTWHWCCVSCFSARSRPCILGRGMGSALGFYPQLYHQFIQYVSHMCVYVSMYPPLWWKGDQCLCHASILFHCAGVLAGCMADWTGQGSGCRGEFLVQRNFLCAHTVSSNLNTANLKSMCLFDRRFARDSHRDWGVRADWNPTLGLTEAH